LLARLYDQPERPGLLWLSFAALFLALGLSRAVAAHKEGDELAAFTLVGLTAAVVSPISWTHHLVFVLPAIVVLGDAALRRRAAAQRLGLGGAGFTFAGLRYATMAFAVFVVFLISPVWWVHHRLDRGGSHYDSGLWGLLAENSMILCMLLLLAVMPWRPGAEPAFPPPGLKHRATLLRSLTDRAGAGRNHAGGIRRDHASGATHDHGSGATRDHAGGAGGSAAARRAQAATPARSAAGTGGAAAGREDGADPGPARAGPCRPGSGRRPGPALTRPGPDPAEGTLGPWRGGSSGSTVAARSPTWSPGGQTAPWSPTTSCRRTRTGTPTRPWPRCGRYSVATPARRPWRRSGWGPPWRPTRCWSAPASVPPW